MPFAVETPPVTRAFGQLVAFFLWTLPLSVLAQDQRLWVDAQINGKAAHLYLDTGSENVWISRPAVDRLGLKLQPSKPILSSPSCQGTVNCTLVSPGLTLKGSFPVYDLRRNPPEREDGMIGWPEVRNRIVVINAEKESFSFLAALPAEVTGWTNLQLEYHWKIFAMKVPSTLGGGVVIVDTGSSTGVGLPPEIWPSGALASKTTTDTDRRVHDG